MYDLQSLREMVEKEGFTCAIAKGEKLFTSTSRGVRPLLDLIESGEDFRGGIAADKIVGKAAALLYAHMGMGEVYACVLGEGGLAVLRGHNISVQFGMLTERIINRAGTDICPMERLCETLTDPVEAYIAIRKRADELATDRHGNHK